MVSDEEARGAIIERARKLIPNIEEVTFEAPMLETVGNAHFLAMRGKQPDGNCASAYVQLVSEEVLAAGPIPTISETVALQGQNVVLYPSRTQACSGVNCEYCTLHPQGGCDCTRAGRGDGGAWCNHSCDAC